MNINIIIPAIISGLLCTVIALIHTHYSQLRSFRIKTALKIVEECDKLLRAYSKLKSSAQTESSEDDINDFVYMHNEFSGDVMIELAYGENEQIKKYREFRERLFSAVMDMNQPDSGRIDRKEEERIAKLKSELFKALLNKNRFKQFLLYCFEAFRYIKQSKIKCSGKYKK